MLRLLRRWASCPLQHPKSKRLEAQEGYTARPSSHPVAVKTRRRILALILHRRSLRNVKTEAGARGIRSKYRGNPSYDGMMSSIYQSLFKQNLGTFRKSLLGRPSSRRLAGDCQVSIWKHWRHQSFQIDKESCQPVTSMVRLPKVFKP